jgi:hypothetical protein
MVAGNAGISRLAAMSTSGRTASICRRGWSRKRKAFSSSSAPHPKAKRSLSAFLRAPGKARKAGVSCLLI